MIIDNSGTGIASLGRDEDRFVAHVAPGERVIPPVISADTQARLSREMMAAGLDPNEYIVGPHMSINPITGQPEFGFLSKVWKKAKKVIKKVAPVAAVIPGPWQPFAAVYQKGSALNNIAKGEGGIGDLLTLGAGGSQKLFGDKGAFANIKAGTGITDLGYVGKNLAFQAKDFASSPLDYLGNIGKTYGENQRQGYGGIFSNVGGADTLGGQTFNTFTSGGNPVNSMITSGYTPGMEGGMMPTSNQSGGGDITTWLNNNFDTSDRRIINGQVAIRAKDGNYYTQEQAKQMYDQQSQPQSQQQGGILDYLSRKLLPQSVEDALKGSDGTINPGSFLSRKLLPQSVEDAFQGSNSSGGMFGGNLGLMGLAGLAGKIAYDASKERMGGIAETPKVTMDQLGRYQMAQNLGTGGSRADFGLAPAPVALQFAKGDVVNMDDYINKMTNELIETYKKDKKYKESSLLPASYIMSDEQEAAQERKKRNMTVSEAIDEYRPSYNLLLMVRKILTGESGDRIPQRKVDEIKNIVRSSIKEKQMNQLGFNMGGIAELDMRDGGESAGPGTGTSDDIPAMLSDGEFVMTAKATRGAGAFDVNKTKSGIELVKGGSASREKGVKNMRELMNIFEAI